MSERNDILDHFVSLLSGISVANGYVNDVAKVNRGMLYWDQEETFPVLMVIGGDEDYEDTLDGNVISTLHVLIRGYSQDASAPETALCSIIADTLKAIDSTSNNYRSGMSIVSLATDEGWFNFQEQSFGYFDLEVTVLYSFVRGNP